jgi:protein-S-isoprenylcysteine O-methyltransferase Ste14
MPSVPGPAVGIALLLWVAYEMWLIAREGRRPPPADLDQGTRWVVFASVTAGSSIAWILSAVAVGRLSAPEWFRPAGALVMVSGLALRAWAVKTLGEHFRLDVTVEEGQPLVSRGPYRYLRHPSYTGTLITLGGWGLGLGSLLSIDAAVGIALPSFLRRIAVEETALRRGMGEPYERYRRRTKRLVPGVW